MRLISNWQKKLKKGKVKRCTRFFSKTLNFKVLKYFLSIEFINLEQFSLSTKPLKSVVNQNMSSTKRTTNTKRNQNWIKLLYKTDVEAVKSINYYVKFKVLSISYFLNTKNVIMYPLNNETSDKYSKKTQMAMKIHLFSSWTIKNSKIINSFDINMLIKYVFYFAYKNHWYLSLFRKWNTSIKRTANTEKSQKLSEIFI